MQKSSLIQSHTPTIKHAVLKAVEAGRLSGSETRRCSATAAVLALMRWTRHFPVGRLFLPLAVVAALISPATSASPIEIYIGGLKVGDVLVVDLVNKFGVVSLPTTFAVTAANVPGAGAKSNLAQKRNSRIMRR